MHNTAGGSPVLLSVLYYPYYTLILYYTLDPLHDCPRVNHYEPAKKKEGGGACPTSLDGPMRDAHHRSGLRSVGARGG